MKYRLGKLLAICATAGMVLAVSRDARAQVTQAAGYTPPDDTPKVSVGGTIFADYTYQDTPTGKDADGNVIHQNAFNLARAYINVTGNISHWVSFRITPDITRQTLTTTAAGTTLSTDGSLVFRLKYAYGQVNFDDFLVQGSWLRFGQQQTPFVDYEEGIYRYRFQGTIFMEREGPGGSGSFLSSSDVGLSSRVVFPGNYGDVHLGVYNGDTYSKAEANDQKAFQVRLSLRPAPMVPVLKGLRLTGFYDGDHYVKDAKRERFIGSLTFEHPYVNVGFDYLDAKDRTSVTKTEVHADGWSGWITPRTPIGIEGLFRYDQFKPNKDLVGKKKRFIGGLAYWFPVTKAGIAAALLADYENVKYEDFPVGNSNAKPQEKRYALHTLFNF